MIRISQLQLPIEHSREDLEHKIRKILSIKNLSKDDTEEIS